MFIEFVFDTSMEFSIVSLGEMAAAVTSVYDYEKCLSLTFQSENSSKSKLSLHCSLPPCFLSSPCDIFLCVCMCVFFFFLLFSFFLRVFFLEEDKWQVCEEGCL